MARQADGSIPDDEDLLRTSSPASLRVGGILLPEAIDLPATSCDRSSLRSAEEAFNPGRPDETCVAAIPPKDLPGELVSPGGVVYAWLAADDPIAENDAHAEIRLLRGGRYDAGHKPASKAFRDKLRDALSSRFRVVLPKA